MLNETFSVIFKHRDFGDSSGSGFYNDFFFRHLQIGSCNVSFKNYPGFFTPCSFWLIFVERKRSAFDDRSCSIIHLEFFRRERLYKKKLEVESIVSQ